MANGPMVALQGIKYCTLSLNGAFTGANQRHAGRFEVANHGTMFLDEIGVPAKPRSPCCACSRNANSSGLEVRKASPWTFE
jgi:hypothetical protein